MENVENKVENLLNEIKALMGTEKKFVKKIKRVVAEEGDNLSKKAYKHLKKLEFYLGGGEEMYKDVIKVLEKYVEKSKNDKVENKEEE